jgi:hypothetical protein
MEQQFVGLDVSRAETAVCVVNAAGAAVPSTAGFDRLLLALSAMRLAQAGQKGDHGLGNAGNLAGECRSNSGLSSVVSRRVPEPASLALPSGALALLPPARRPSRVRRA